MIFGEKHKSASDKLTILVHESDTAAAYIAITGCEVIIF